MRLLIDMNLTPRWVPFLRNAALFGWRQITFWQGLGLLALCRILFGGFGGGGGHRSRFRQRMDERWERMTPEEREKFQQGMRSGCGSFGAPASGTTGPA